MRVGGKLSVLFACCYTVCFTFYLYKQLDNRSQQTTCGQTLQANKPEQWTYTENVTKDDQADAKIMSSFKNADIYRKMFAYRFGSFYRVPIKMVPPQRKGVIIFSYQRSGTSFLGQLFNQHEDAFYTFEPLMPFYDICETQVGDKLRVIKATLQCNFLDVEGLYTTQAKREKGNYPVHQLCMKDNFCFRQNTRELCERKLCPYGDQTHCNHCGPVHIPRVNNVCRLKNLSAVKIIRLCNMKHLESLVDNPATDIKVLHLVRDPRGIQSSRTKINAESTWKLNSSKELCNRMLQDGKVGLSVTEDTEWLKGRYMLVRYEDVAHNPMQKAEEIYRFSGLDFNPAVRTWIKQNTQASAKDTPINPYATRRNSSSTAESWKSYLSFEEILRIQEDCAEVMEMFGYKPVKDKSELPIRKIKIVNGKKTN